MTHFKQGRLEISGGIRIFCQKKIVDDANSARTTSRHDQAEQAAEHGQIVLDSGMKKNGGWGYFMVERGENFSPTSSLNPHNCIDLYLYKEGE
jgi:hypothetical protein